jgi:hypothetical protein
MKKPVKSSNSKKLQGIRPPKSMTTPRSIKPLVINLEKKNRKAN